MSMSSGSRVRLEGTIAMSSKPYARRPCLPRPISTSIEESLQSRRTSIATPLGPLGMLDRMNNGDLPSYDPHTIEARRQHAWQEQSAFRTPPADGDRPRKYIKPSAPFTSGNIHIGHVRSYSIGDAYARFCRARGEDVLFAFGFDSFGLPAELGAIEGKEPPSAWVDRCAKHMTGQLQRLGFSFDWERTFMSSEAIMYRWSQWLFLTLLEAGLVY